MIFKAVLFDLDNTLVDFMRFKRKCSEAAIRAMIEAGLPMEEEKAVSLLFKMYKKYGIENQDIFSKFLCKAQEKVDYRILASGIADPSYIISEGCNLGPTMQCNFQVYSTGDISTGGTTVIAFNVSNGFGYNVSIKSFLVSLESDDAIFAELVDSGSPFVVPSGESFSDKAELGFSASPGSLQKFNVHVEYVSCAKEINPECKVDDSFKPHTVTGKIVGRVLKGQ